MSGKYFLSVCLNPVLQKTIVLERLWENEVNRSKEYYLDASGKGLNVCRVLTQLGENAVLLSQAGGLNKDIFLKMAQEDGVNCDWIDSHSEIRFCYTLLNKAGNTTTEIVEEARLVAPNIEKIIYNEFRKKIRNSHTLIISGTKADGFSSELYPKMVRDAKKIGVTVILDLKGDDLKNSLRYKPDIIKPNLCEFLYTFFPASVVKEHDDQKDIMIEIKEKMNEIYSEYGSITLLTRGKFGVIIFDEKELVFIPAEVIKPVNTTGCGDAFTAGFASLWYKTKDLITSAQLGMECAKKNALLIKPGTIL
jgi:1-phosphofructokinase family hexose kinase